MTLLDLYNVLLLVGIPVSHYEGELDEYPHIVYQEFNTTYDTASGRAYRKKTRVEITHYTKVEFDPTIDILKGVLLEHDLYFTVATTFNPENEVITNQGEVTITGTITETAKGAECMKLITSQDGRQVFTIGLNNYINIAPIETDGTAEAKVKPYSIGISGISVGVFKDEAKAKAALDGVTAFLSGKDTAYTIPANK
jgi:flagellar hook protein FlgE